jgi:hypothetical protein
MTKLHQAALGLALTASALGSTPAVAATDPLPAAIQRVADGSYTTADLALIRQHPKVAAQVPDPTQRPVIHARSGDSSSGKIATARVLGSCGHWVDVWFRKRSLTRKTLYKWHHRLVYCYTSRRITDWQRRYDYLTDASSVVYFRGLEVNEKGGGGTATAWSHRQRHLEFCILSQRIGCYASLHPWSKIKVYAGGGYSFKGDNS